MLLDSPASIVCAFMALTTAAAAAEFDRVVQTSLIDSRSIAPDYFSRKDARIKPKHAQPSREA